MGTSKSSPNETPHGSSRGINTRWRMNMQAEALAEALEHFVSVEPRDLFIEAKVEYCRATRDLRSCGRTVQHVLVSCGHACLCDECSQRCGVCPICRSPVTKPESGLRLRLYEELVDAGLLPQARVEDLQEREKDGQFLNMDVRRLSSFFDVALENNLVSLICHYVSEVCMDEAAVSSDALVSMLLDGDVVKEWCKRTTLSVTRVLRDIYNLGPKQMQNKVDVMYKNLRKLEGIGFVLEALEAAVVDPLSVSLLEVRQILEGVRKVSQHLEVMAWCARNRFLENVPSRFANNMQWRAAVKERRSSAQERAWLEHPRNVDHLGERPQATLFIDDALANLGLGREEEDEGGKDTLELNRLKLLRSRRDGSGTTQAMLNILYPPDSMRGAVDVLFLEGSSELILAKKAIFLYYLFDRHWTLSDASWRNIVDDYVGVFSISRPFMLESLVFYLLDDSSDQALEEACCLLPEIVSPNIHPKVSHVLLEREKPDAALSILRCSGRDGRFGVVNNSLEQPVAVPVQEAITAVRVRLQCGLLTEAYLYQRAHCLRVKSQEVKRRLAKPRWQHGHEMGETRKWALELEMLVGEICWFCSRRGLLEQAIALPWLVDEEKVVKKCLLDQAIQDPSAAAGNFLVVFYIQRCRYIEAYMVHKRLCDLEQQYIARTMDGEKVLQIQTARAHRTRITEACMDLLPLIQRQQVRSGIFSHPDFMETNSGASSDQMELERSESSFSPVLASNSTMVSPLFQSSLSSRILSAQGSLKSRDDLTLLITSSMDDYLPSILHGRAPFRPDAGGSPLRSHFSSPVSNGLATPRDYGSNYKLNMVNSLSAAVPF